MTKAIYIDPSIKQPEKFKSVLEGYGDNIKVISKVVDCAPETIEVAIIWLSVPQIIRTFCNLKLLLVCGSGVDHLINSDLLPRSVPLVRLVDRNLRERVADYVLKHVNIYFNDGSAGVNLKVAPSNVLFETGCTKRVIGILGLGLVGTAIADKLIKNGFEVCGWVKKYKKRSIENVYVGASELKEFAENCNVIVCQLPLTADTRGILNKELFNAMPQGSHLINVGRGGHLNENDLIVALNSGQLSGACLDVFNVEPLPLDHNFHSNSKITVTPHIAGIIEPENLAHYAMTVIRSFYENKEVEGIVDYKSNY